MRLAIIGVASKVVGISRSTVTIIHTRSFTAVSESATSSMSSKLRLLHFNDVYRVQKQKIKGGGTIDVTQFSALVDSLRQDPSSSSDSETRRCLLVFSGDVFSPSVESTVTRGSHMVPVMNKIAPDVALTGLWLFFVVESVLIDLT